MKPSPKPQPAPSRCFDGICETMDKLGIPRNSKWRALILFMRSIADYDIYSAEQKRHVQELVVHVLKERDLSDERFTELSKKNEDILSAPWRDRLKHALADLAQAIGDSRGMILKRKGEIEQLGSTTVEVVQSGKDIDEVVSDIRKGFQDVVRFMEEDAENLSRMSYTDSLTGLHNRRAFEETLSRAVERATAKKQPLCVLMADVDRFKDFNDRHGHLIGDQALSAVASVLRECQRQAQERGVQLFTARYGGEEFTVVSENLGFHHAIALAEHIRHRIETYNFVIRDVDGEILDTGIKLTISIGVGCLDPAWKGAIEQRLVNAADEALYAAKQAGRNRVMPSEG